MKFPWHFPSIVLLACLSASGQTSIHQAPGKDTTVLVPPHIQADIDSFTLMIKGTKEGSEKIRLYGKICWSYLGISHFEMAARYADSTKILAEHLKDSQGIMKSVYYAGVMARLKGDYTESLNYLEQYMRFHERNGDSSRVAGVLYQVGIVHSHLGNYANSLAAYYRLIPIEEKDRNDYSVGYTLNAIGIILSETKKYTDAEKIYLKALHIFDTLDAKTNKTDVLVNLGNLNNELGQYNKAMQYYQQALQIDREIGKQTGIAVSLANIAYLFDEMKMYDSALVYHHQGLRIREKLSSKGDLSRSLIGVGRGYRQLNNFDSAKYWLFKALALVKEIGSKPMLRDVYENLADMSAKTANFSKAYEYHLLYSTIKDSVLSEQTAKTLGELQIKYEAEQKDKQILTLANEKKLQEQEAERQSTIRKALVGGLLLVIVLAILLVYIFRQRLKNQRLLGEKNIELKEVNFKRQMTELEMKALRAQINPHFLFNCMNSINRLILKGETEKASNYLTKFSKLVRLILENAETPMVSLHNELALLESYIQLEGLRFKGKINYNITVDESIEPESTYLPSMVLQPFVENAIWHGLMHKKENEMGNIKINVKEENDRLMCIIEDNGVGREKAGLLREKSIYKGKSMGMKITEDRLRLLNQENSDPVVWITDLKDNLDHPSGTRIQINIPIS